MASFIDVIDNLATTLEDNAALKSFCAEKWSKSLIVLTVFKERTEIQLSDLPIVLITRPETTKDFSTGTRDGTHTVRLYCGFRQEDRLKAMKELIEFEEKLDDALLVDHTRGGIAIDTDPKASANDEGKFHPVYFMVMDVTIQHRR